MQEETPCKCVSKLKIAAHGSYDDYSDEARLIIGKKRYYESTKHKEISSLFKNVNFCKKCTIELVVCHIGSSKLLKERLLQYKCEVKLYDDLISPTV